MLPCVPHLINIAQLGGLGRKEQRGIWRAGEAVFAHESEILSAFPAEPAQGCARRMAGSRRGHFEVAVGSCKAPLTQAFPSLSQARGVWQGMGGVRPRPRRRVGKL